MTHESPQDDMRSEQYLLECPNARAPHWGRGAQHRETKHINILPLG